MAAEIASNGEIESRYKKYKPNIAKGGMRFAPIRRVEYVPTVVSPETSNPYLQVKQRQDGQYVVIEKYPTTYHNRSIGKISSVHASLANSGVKFRTIKPRWRYAINGDFLANEDNLNLPSVDLGWTKKSKCGSLDYYYHKPGGGTKRIFSESLRWKVKSKVGSLENVSYGKSRSRSYPSYEHYGLYLPDVSPRYEAKAQTGAIDHMHYTPGQYPEKLHRNRRYEQAQSHIHSLDNIGHRSQGGNVILPHFKKDWKEPSESKVGSLDFVHHKPGGGNFRLPPVRKLKWTVKSKVGSMVNVEHEPEKNYVKIPHFKAAWKSRSKIRSLDNIHHLPGGGAVTLPKRPVNWKIRSKVDSKPRVKIIYEREESDYSMDSF